MLLLFAAVFLSSARTLGLTGSKLDASALPPSAGFTYELCAGIIDKQKSVAAIAVEEVLEECGYQVTEDCLEEITKCRLSYCTEVTISWSVECVEVIKCRSVEWYRAAIPRGRHSQ